MAGSVGATLSRGSIGAWISWRSGPGSPRGPVAAVAVTAFHSDDGERARTRMTALLADAVATLH
ncbi:MAG TPA: hypothetical protein VHR88_01675 [Solirubrobacteraceae bacterium]|nr:hypothetical protein [Solirubrobacteraceae bacterium]